MANRPKNMSDFLNHLNIYSSLLTQGSVWLNSDEILAPVTGTSTTKPAEKNYIYEFYCYISIVVDLINNYDIRFIEGKGKSRFKFPQAASSKKNKPRFHAFENGSFVFQICAGTKVSCPLASEDNNPDISFQMPGASDTPTQNDLIIIMDAKFKEDEDADLPKTEVYKFGLIVDLFNLKNVPTIPIKFHRFKNLYGNCLLTNGQSYSNYTDDSFLKHYNIKEVENFSPGKTHRVLG
jgi:hypothetical protein